MREIKFRAWFNKKPDWWKRQMFYSDDEPAGIGDWFYEVQCYQEDAPIMQFTGLKDKNGKEIYEGDIVRAIYKDMGSGEEITEEYEMEWECTDPGPGYVGFNVGNYQSIEIIGNVWENPELLTEQTKD